MPAEFEMGSPQSGGQDAGPPPAAPPAEPPGGDVPPSPGPGQEFNSVWNDLDDSPPSAQTLPEQPQPPAPPAPPAQTGPDTTELQRQLEEVNRKLAAAEQRYSETHKWGNEAHMANAVAQGLIQAQQQRERIEREMAAAQQAAIPPQIDPDELLSDPKAMAAALQRYGQWSVQQALAQVMPHISYLRSEAEQVAMARPLVEGYARQEARRALVAQGVVDEADADRVLGQAYGLIDREPHAAAYRLKPEAIAYAAAIAIQQEQGGKPITVKPKEAPSAGSGDRSAPRRSGNGLSETGSKVARHVEQVMGITFTDQERAELARMNRR